MCNLNSNNGSSANATNFQQCIPADAVITIYTREGLPLASKPAFNFTAKEVVNYAADHIWQLEEDAVIIKVYK